MTVDEVIEFVREHHRAVLATHRRDGGFQLSPVAAVPDEDGTILVSSREAARKTLNLRRDPRGALCVFTDGFFGPWVSAEGRFEVVSLPAAMEALIGYYRRGFGEHPDWDDYRAAMERDRRVILRLRVERVGPQASG